MLDLSSGVPDSVSLGWGPRICNLKQFPGDAAAAEETHCENHSLTVSHTVINLLLWVGTPRTFSACQGAEGPFPGKLALCRDIQEEHKCYVLYEPGGPWWLEVEYLRSSGDLVMPSGGSQVLAEAWKMS